MLRITVKSTVLGEISKVTHAECIEEDLGHEEHTVQRYYCSRCREVWELFL